MRMFEIFRTIIRDFFGKIQRAFNPTHEGITFESFNHFAFLFLRMAFLDFRSLSEDATLKTRIQYYSKRIFYFIGLFLCALGTMQGILFGVSHSDDFTIVVRAISDSSIFIHIQLKTLTIFWCRKGFSMFYQDLKSIFESRSRAKSITGATGKYFKTNNRVAKFYIFLFVSINIVNGLSLALYIFTEKRAFISNLWFPFDEFQANLFPVALIWELLVIYFFLAFLVSSDLLLYSLIILIALEFDLMKSDLSNLKVQSKKERRRTIATWVDRHNKLFELSKKLQELFELSFVYNFIMSAIIICLLLFHLLAFANNFYLTMVDIIALATVIGSTFTLCYFGQKLIDSSAGGGIYECDWTDVDVPDFKKQLVIIMIRAQRSTRLTAMGFADLSLETFANVRIYE